MTKSAQKTKITGSSILAKNISMWFIALFPKWEHLDPLREGSLAHESNRTSRID